ncbi:hypothetical protein AWM70_02695 [Paenibacillus yonginensis]|uniref:YgiT-type zinc finger domain-containing protein n=2 Tax=Paenibacillus TaxID=44249 RepID=A0A1B1MWS4_9BACL|nr:MULTISPECIES: hypothetical protein [Paenibacillus]ANS73618.1 hypothetical protein AWM70_02695 [Paenibacillus yonginensis]GGA38090.1 hypothetical protein GCM10010917_24180 [Paenibacillus physcomitrellae]
MSFCCGASMVGTKGTLKHYRTQVHNVPLLLCPVCHRVEVHYKVENEYEILAEYAHADGAQEIDFADFVSEDDESIFVNCVNDEREDPLDIVKRQIDSSLDLLTVAKHIGDEKWESELKRRLAFMSRRRERLQHR